MSLSATGVARERVRIAIQKSGRLAEPSRALLRSCGLEWREGRDRLFCHGESLPIDLLLVRDDDIPGLLADGVCDLGIVGRNVLAEQAAGRALSGQPHVACELRALGFGDCRLDLAVPQAWDWQGPEQLRGRRIATSYPQLVRQWLEAQRIQAEVVLLSGSVEIAPRLGQADLVCDLVSSGATLAANQLKPVLTLLQSESVLAGPASPFTDARSPLVQLLLRRMDGVLNLKDSRLVMFQADRAQVETLLKLLPDAEPPTMVPLDSQDTLALQALCRGEMTWQRLEDLRRAGAHELMVLSVERSLA
ncbi:MAG: ATP phosphoribosyltransferase [Luteimonas sp.]